MRWKYVSSQLASFGIWKWEEKETKSGRNFVTMFWNSSRRPEQRWRQVFALLIWQNYSIFSLSYSPFWDFKNVYGSIKQKKEDTTSLITISVSKLNINWGIKYLSTLWLSHSKSILQHLFVCAWRKEMGKNMARCVFRLDNSWQSVCSIPQLENVRIKCWHETKLAQKEQIKIKKFLKKSRF